MAATSDSGVAETFAAVCEAIRALKRDEPLEDALAKGTKAAVDAVAIRARGIKTEEDRFWW